ncbi:MAG TPA: hypothetical protein VF159_13400 [Gemmatimonadaceae bacterium]|jgi:hypothetical protein
MEYAKPELVVVGQASALVLGGLPGEHDNPNADTERPIMGIALGLDD